MGLYNYTYKYGIQVFDLSVDQLCSLLQNVDPTKGKSVRNYITKTLTIYAAKVILRQFADRYTKSVRDAHAN